MRELHQECSQSRTMRLERSLTQTHTRTRSRRCFISLLVNPFNSNSVHTHIHIQQFFCNILCTVDSSALSASRESTLGHAMLWGDMIASLRYTHLVVTTIILHGKVLNTHRHTVVGLVQYEPGLFWRTYISDILSMCVRVWKEGELDRWICQ